MSDLNLADRDQADLRGGVLANAGVCSASVPNGAQRVESRCGDRSGVGRVKRLGNRALAYENVYASRMSKRETLRVWHLGERDARVKGLGERIATRLNLLY